MVINEFKHKPRVTMTLVISAARDASPSFVVFQEILIPYRTVLRDGLEYQTKLAVNLSRWSVNAKRAANGVFDTMNFRSVAGTFLNYVKGLTKI